jgi:hypothetical protein
MHSKAVREDRALFSWGVANEFDVPTGLGHADMQNKLVPTCVASRHMQGARVGRCHSLPPQH